MSIQDINGKSKEIFEQLAEKRAKRLWQIAIATTSGLGLALLVAKGSTQPILMAAMCVMLLAGWFAKQQRITLSATLLLTDIFVMLSILIAVSGGIHDIGMLGYPLVLVMAAMLGNSYLFAGLLLAIIVYSSTIAIMTVQGHFHMVFPTVTYSHLVYVNVIFLVTGFSVFLMVKDMHRLMLSLRDENNRVKEREKTIVQLANQDQLTGLPNRRYAENYFESLYDISISQKESLAVFFLDLDNFKPVNDSLGHAAGDLVLQQLAQRLQALAAADDILCRFGGDEFLWIKAVKDRGEKKLKKSLEEDADKLLKAAILPFHIMQNKIDISGSVGVAIAPEHGQSFSELCRAADLAMYHAKTKGRNTFSFYDEDLDRINIDKYQLLKKIREALTEQQFQVWYQPKFDLKENRTSGCEALIRWPQASGGFIAPVDFIPLAESSGLIAEIGAWVLERACLDAMRWREAGFIDIKVAVNLSYVQFRDASLPKQIEKILTRTGLPACALELELTESLLINDEDGIQKQLDAIVAMGVSIAIDDFGTGYSNLSYLRQFNARSLKIDKSFITALGVSVRDEPLVQAMIQMAHSLGLRTVAEGVETIASLEQLRLMGCDIGQGYYWSPALPYDKWLEYLQKNEKTWRFVPDSQHTKTDLG